MFPYMGMGGGVGGAGGGMGQGNMGPGNMGGGSGMPNALSMGGMNASMGALGGMNPTMQALQNMNPTMQALYQQYAIRWAAMQKFAQAAQAASAAGMGGMTGPLNAGMGARSAMGGSGPGPRSGPSGPPPDQNQDPGVFYKTRICNKWREGHCPFGDTCKYAHGEHEMRHMQDNIREGVGSGWSGPALGPGPRSHGQAGPSSMPREREIRDHRSSGEGRERKERNYESHKTRLCAEFMNSGRCKYGAACTFAHGQHDLRQSAGSTQGTDKRAPQPNAAPAGKDSARKTRLCEKFMQTGNCGYGDKCTFAHGTHELQSRVGGPSSGGGGDSGARPARPPASSDAPPSSKPSAAPGATAPSKAAGAGTGTGGQQGQQLPQSQPQVHKKQSPRPGQEEVDKDKDQGQVQGLTGGGVGEKRRLEEVEDEEEAAAAGGEAKKLHAAEEESASEPDCPLCAQLVKMGRAKVLSAIDSLESPKAKQLGAMILAASQRLDQLWVQCTPTMLLGWMGKMQGLTVMDKIELLKAVLFHVHVPEDAGENARAAGGPLGLDSQKYVDMGLPPDCADFVYVCMEGVEGTTTMSEYFHMLEVCKQLFGINDDNYYTVSTAVAGIMMSM